MEPDHESYSAEVVCNTQLLDFFTKVPPCPADDFGGTFLFVPMETRPEFIQKVINKNSLMI
jgi:hypothetical protein